MSSRVVHELAGRGWRVDQHFLEQMYVHVELQRDVRDALPHIDSAGPATDCPLPEFDARLSEVEGAATR